MVGLSGIVVKSHGGADSIAFSRAIALAAHAARRGLTAHRDMAARSARHRGLDVFPNRRHRLAPARTRSHELRPREDGRHQRRMDSRCARASSAGTSRPTAKPRSISAERARRAVRWTWRMSAPRKSTSSPSAPPRPIWFFRTAACCFSAAGRAGRAGIQRRDRVQRVHVRAVDRRQVRARRRSQVRSRRGRGNALTHHGLEGPLHLRAVRDGAGAVVLKPSAEPGVLSTHLHADGTYRSCSPASRHLARLRRTCDPTRWPSPWRAARCSRSR